MCDFLIGVSNVHHNQVKINFNHFHLMELNKKGNNLWKEAWIVKETTLCLKSKGRWRRNHIYGPNEDMVLDNE